MSQIILAFWLVLTYDQLEDRRIDDVITFFFVSLLYKTSRFHVACVCPEIDHRRRKNAVRTSVTHSAIAACDPLFLTTF
jgi:hypothetical protein